MKMAILSDLAVWQTEAGYAAAPPGDVMEINALASLSDDFALVGVAAGGAPPPHAAPLCPQIRVFTTAPSGGRGPTAKLRALASSLRSIPRLHTALRGRDMVQLRCPSKLAFLGLALLVLKLDRPRLWVRWGGEWSARPGEPPSYRLQRLLLRWELCDAKTTFVGLGGLPNPTRSALELEAAEQASRRKRLSLPLRLLFPARLVADKGGAQVLAIGAELVRRGWTIHIDIAGDGPERGRLEALARGIGLGENAFFHGWLGRTDLDRLAARAHFILLPSKTEGFPRALHEAMAFRCVPLASPVGCIPQSLAAIDERLLQPADRPKLWADQIDRLADAPSEWRWLADHSQQLAAGFSAEAYQAGVLELWRRTWGLKQRLDDLEALQ